MATKNMGYDHPAYIARLSHGFGQNAAGASTAFGKFAAFAALTVFAVDAVGITNGTSTYTAWNGTKTVVAINGDSFSLIRVFNTNTSPISAPTLATSTYGPYALALGTNTATLTGTDTTTGAAGVLNSVGVSQTGAAAATANGGISINAGDTLHIVRGTDATAVSAFAIEYGITPLANVTL